MKTVHFRLIAGAVILSFLSGCAAVHTTIAKRELDIQTKTSTAIFVDPVAPERRTVYAEIRSGVMEFDRKAFNNYMRQEFSQNSNGYRLVNNPDAAQYHMMIYVTSLEKTSPTAAEQALKRGYVGDVAAGARAGMVMGGERGRSGSAAAAGGIAGAIGTTAANAFVQDVLFMLVADVKITEKTRKGVIVRKDTQISAKVSDAGASTQRVSEATNRKEYTTRIVTTANKANLKLDEAQPTMFQKTAYAMAGFF